jgi:hypothetical protein
MTRPISKDEVAVLQRTLRVGLVSALSPGAIETVGQLRVTATCKCGCATVWFGPDGDAASGIKAAEACATWNGESIDVIVWAIEGQIVGLEVAGPGEPGLPEPASVRRFEEYFQAPSV